MQRRTDEHDTPPDGHEEPPFDQGESLGNPCRRGRPKMVQRVEELHERFSLWGTMWTKDQAQHAALATCFNTFESRYYAAEEERRIFEKEEREERRSFKVEPHNEWVQQSSFEEADRAQRRSFEDEQRAEWARAAMSALQDIFSFWWPLSTPE